MTTIWVTQHTLFLITKFTRLKNEGMEMKMKNNLGDYLRKNNSNVVYQIVSVGRKMKIDRRLRIHEADFLFVFERTRVVSTQRASLTAIAAPAFVLLSYSAASR